MNKNRTKQFFRHTMQPVNSKHWLLSNITDKDCGSVDEQWRYCTSFIVLNPGVLVQNSVIVMQSDETCITKFAKASNADQPFRIYKHFIYFFNSPPWMVFSKASFF